MAYFGPNDMGYHPDRHNLLSYNADGTLVVGRNPSNIWTSDGYDFSCMNVTPYTQNERDGYVHNLVGPLFPGRPPDCEADIHSCPTDVDIYQYGGEDPSGFRPQSPRIVMVTRQWGIVTQHYRKQYFQCPDHPDSDWDGEPGSENHERWKYQFMDSAGNKVDRWIEKQFLMSCNSDGGDCGGNCGCYHDLCGEENPYYGKDVDKLCASQGNDYVLVRLSEPLPNLFIPAKIASKEFILANMNDSGPPTQTPRDIKKQRHCIMVDQFNRVGIRNYSHGNQTLNPNININGGNYNNVSMGCGSKLSVAMSQTSVVSSMGFPRSLGCDLHPECGHPYWGEPEGIDVGWSRINRTYGGQYPEPWDGDIPESVIHLAYDTYGTDKLPSSYNFRDDISRPFSGDSSSPIFFALNNELILTGKLTWSGEGGTMNTIDSYRFREAMEKIIDEHGDEQPTFIDENYDISAHNPPEDIIGYRVYKSTISKDGPFFDITSAYKNSTWADDLCSAGEECYRLGHTFVDINVDSGNKYWYYTTSVKRDNTVLIEGTPSDIVEVVVAPPESAPPEDGIEYGRTDVHPLSFPTQSSTYYQVFNTTIQPPISPTYVPLIEGYRLGNESHTIPFFGFKNPFETPILPSPKDQDFNIFFKTSKGEIGNLGILEGIPLPTDPTSYPYILGYAYGSAPTLGKPSNYLLSLGVESSDFISLSVYMTQIKEIWLSRNFPNPNNENLRSKLEPYYHSKIHFDRIPNLEKVVINPARYGNGRSDWGESWASVPADPNIGYYMGEYLANDLISVQSSLKTLIAKDSSVDSEFRGMEYFSLSGLDVVEEVDLSNNSLYRIDFGDTNDSIKSLYLSNNELGNKTDWIDSSDFPNEQTDFPIHKLKNNIQRLDVSNNNISSLTKGMDVGEELSSLIYLNVSNNKNLGDIVGGHSSTTEVITAPNLKWLDLSNCSFSSTSGQQSLLLNDMFKLEQLLINNTSIKRMQVGENQNEAHFFALLSNIEVQNNPELGGLNLKTNAGDFRQFGHTAKNIETVTANNNPNMSFLLLPDPDDNYVGYAKKYVKYVNVDNNISLDTEEFFSQGVFTNIFDYPEGHQLVVSAQNIPNISGGTLVQLMQSWAFTGRNLIIYY